jgi:histidyl-tRNA synthetase
MWYWGPMFRYERPQAGRLRQFYQLGVENVGGDTRGDLGHTVQKDFEVIAAALECLDMVFEHRVDFELHVNNLGGRDTIKLYNKELTSFLSDHSARLSTES